MAPHSHLSLKHYSDSYTSELYMPRIRHALVILATVAALTPGALANYQNTALLAQHTRIPKTPLPSHILSHQDVPEPSSTVWPSMNADLRRRTATDDATSKKPQQPKSDDDGDSKSVKSVTNTDASATTINNPNGKATTRSTAAQSPLPSPFDGVGGKSSTNFPDDDGDKSCPTFMKDLLSNPSFKDCYPLSMMLQTSSSMFQAEKNIVSLTRVLDATCAADAKSCIEFMDNAAKDLTASDNCKKEYENGETEVTKAYQGLKAYGMLYSVSCLQDPDKDAYCFADAFTNLTSPSNNYLYFMPYGLPLPGASLPTCNWCTQQTMAIYHAASKDRKQLIAKTYTDAARQVNTICGPDFVNDTLPDKGAAALHRPTTATTLVVVLSLIVALVSGL